MQRNGSFNFGKVLKNFKALQSTLPKEIATDTVKYFKANFRAQGFDNGKEKWQPRENNKDPGRAILKKSGNLRDAIRVQGTPSFRQILIIDSMPYAAINNFGGVIKKAALSRVISFSNEGGISRFAKTKTNKQRNAITHQARATTGAHTIKMPKREFMGDSNNLRAMHLKTIKRRLADVFKV